MNTNCKFRRLKKSTLINVDILLISKNLSEVIASSVFYSASLGLNIVLQPNIYYLGHFGFLLPCRVVVL